MVTTFGNDIVSAFTGGNSVKEIYMHGEKVWSNEQPTPPGSYYISWLPSNLSGTFSIGNSTYRFEDYSGYFSDFDGTIPHKGFYNTGVTRIETNAYNIGRLAFANCHSLKSVYLPNCENLQIAQVFYQCHSLTTVSLPICSLLGAETFAGCENLSSIDLPMCTMIGSSVFKISSYSEPLYISVPLCERYYDACFVGRRLQSAADSFDFTNCTYVGSLAFKSAINIALSYPIFNFPNCSRFEKYAFCDCGIVNLKLSKAEYIGDYAFYYSDYTFDEYTFVRKISIYTSSVCVLGGSHAFKPGDLFYVPSSLLSAYKTAPYWSEHSNNIYKIN